MTTQFPNNEKKRLKVLWQYDILDTLPESIFDDLTELAARICEAPMAIISLVDEERQWFKSKLGVTVRETSRDVSFCSHAIRQDGLFIVPDATKDDRFSKNPLVTADPKIRFYAGAPLISPDGYALGTLCVLDQEPRVLRPDQQVALSVLARHVMAQLELRREVREVSQTFGLGKGSPVSKEVPVKIIAGKKRNSAHAKLAEGRKAGRTGTTRNSRF